ncbi:hypothetical protein PBY51_011361 [Eleginops maclovinus]|uniref:Mixed lineage kinase domain-containing protein n=1 Tax=Eleginops maclovinus TaxID=56733 RepID=A0AAN8ATN5_ELEMC|nr:hypothetical protein PBY51_011361 [Eleginops maclovinus]
MAALDPFLGVVDFSLNLCSTICRRAANVSAHKERCQQIAQRVKALEGLILIIKHGGVGQLSPAVHNALREICSNLTSAKTLMEKIGRTKAVMRFLKSSSQEGQFLYLDKRLSDNFKVLSGLIEHGDTLSRARFPVSGNTGPTTPIPQPSNTPQPSPPSPIPYSPMPPMAACNPEPHMHYSRMPPMAMCSPTPSVIYTMLPIYSVPFSTTISSNPATSTMDPMIVLAANTSVVTSLSSKLFFP